MRVLPSLGFLSFVLIAVAACSDAEVGDERGSGGATSVAVSSSSVASSSSSASSSASAMSTEGACTKNTDCPSQSGCVSIDCGAHRTCLDFGGFCDGALAGPPVCGCDGKRYGSFCELASKNIDECPLATCASPALGVCRGVTLCEKTTEYCAGETAYSLCSQGNVVTPQCELAIECPDGPSCDCLLAESSFANCTCAVLDGLVTLDCPH